jgi:hypothetical protein
MARVGRNHAPSPEVRKGRELNANGPIAPQILAPQTTFPREKPPARDRRLRQLLSAAPHFRMEFAGLPWDLIRTCGTPRRNFKKAALWPPATGSAPHQLITAPSVKKALMGLRQSLARAAHRRSGNGPGIATSRYGHIRAMLLPGYAPGRLLVHRRFKDLRRPPIKIRRALISAIARTRPQGNSDGLESLMVRVPVGIVRCRPVCAPLTGFIRHVQAHVKVHVKVLFRFPRSTRA